MGIFSENAPRLWALGLPVMPLEANTKKPVMKSWQEFANRMPTPEEQAFWLANNANGNIGLPLGPQSGLVALDIDTEDEALYKLVCSIVPSSPWNRIGRHGKVMLFKYTGQKTFRIKDINGVTICELLSAKTQVVLPPSIHPDTQKAYTSDTDLAEVCRQVPVLDPNIETILRSALIDAGVTLSHSGHTNTVEYVSRGSRDVKMTTMAGFYAASITRGELSVKEAISRMYAWKSACVEQVAGDDIDIEKGVRNLISFLVRDVIGPKNKILPRGWDEGLTAEEKTQMGLNFDVELEEWDYERLKQYLFEQFSIHADDSVQRSEAVEYILRRITRSPNLTSLEEDKLISYISQSCKNMKATALRRHLNELKKGDIAGNNHAEIAEAVIKEISQFTPIRFHNDKLWRWNGSNWEIQPDQEVLQQIARDFGHLPAAARANDHAGILKVIKNLLPQGLVQKGIKEVKGVNFANGFVGLDGQLHPHSPDHGMTYTLPFRYVPEMSDLSNAPKFSKFLEDVWGMEPDYETRVKALQEVMAATFFGISTSFSRSILLYGIAGSGKSQLLDITKHLLPSEVVTYVTPYDFDDKFKITELSRSLMNICGELHRDKRIPSANFKQVIDGTMLSGQYKGRPLFDFKPKAAHWFASNYLPKADDDTEGFNRRWVILSFNHPVPEEKRIRNLSDIIVAEEREAIASWVVQVIKDLSIKGEYTIPASHYNFVSEMSSANDSLFAFLVSDKGPRKVLHEDGSLNTKEKIHIDKLQEEYSTFCYSVEHTKPVGPRRYSQRLRELTTFMGLKMDSSFIYGVSMDKSPSMMKTSIPLIRNF